MKIISEYSLNPIYKKLFKIAAKYLGQPKYLTVGLNFLNSKEICELNKATRSIDEPTDVLSFPNLPLIADEIVDRDKFSAEYDLTAKHLFLGEIVICKDIAFINAANYGHSEKRELGFLFVHGLLHLLGYDHINPEQETEMRKIQTQILSLAKLKR